MSFASGTLTKSSGSNSLTSGSESIASATNAVAFGEKNVASGINSSAHGESTQAQSDNSATFGYKTTTNGYAAFAEGINTQAISPGSHAAGEGTIASGVSNQFVIGQYNEKDEDGKYLFIIGNGTYDSDSKTTTRSNAIAVDWQGKIYVNNSDTGVDVLDLLNRVKALETALDGLKLKKTTTSEYDSLEQKDNNTVYFCTE